MAPGAAATTSEKSFRLLQAAGYELRGRKLVEAKSGRQLEFEILASSTSQEGLLLSFARDVERLGIKVKLRVVDGAQYQQRLTRLRLRHDPEHVDVLALAGQRAAVPLVDAGGEDATAPITSPASRTRPPTP